MKPNIKKMIFMNMRRPTTTLKMTAGIFDAVCSICTPAVSETARSKSASKIPAVIRDMAGRRRLPPEFTRCLIAAVRDSFWSSATSRRRASTAASPFRTGVKSAAVDVIVLSLKLCIFMQENSLNDEW